MRIALLAIAFALIIQLSSATAPIPSCATIGQSCVNSCCGSLGGSQSGEDFPCALYTEAGEGQYMDCHRSCIANKIRCMAPTSGCDTMYSLCASQCSGETGERWDCMQGCAATGTTCASQASTPTPGGGGDGSCCCGGGLILLFAGLGALLVSRKS